MADSEQDAREENVNTVPAEDGSKWIEIASSGTVDEANLIAGFLEAEGIQAQVENVQFGMEPITFGAMGDIRVYVHEGNEVRAQELLRSREQAFERLDDDDETLVTDEGPVMVDENAPVESDGGTNTP